MQRYWRSWDRWVQRCQDAGGRSCRSPRAQSSVSAAAAASTTLDYHHTEVSTHRSGAPSEPLCCLLFTSLSLIMLILSLFCLFLRWHRNSWLCVIVPGHCRTTCTTCISLINQSCQCSVHQTPALLSMSWFSLCILFSLTLDLASADGRSGFGTVTAVKTGPYSGNATRHGCRTLRLCALVKSPDTPVRESNATCCHIVYMSDWSILSGAGVFISC